MRNLFLLAGMLALAGCTSRTYTIEAATPNEGNERAARYCYLQDATARLEGIERRNGKSVEVYRCVPGAAPAQVLTGTTY
jgi:uncharacterized lipoprotein YajG